MKKLNKIVAGLSSLLLLAACGNGDSTEDTPNTSSNNSDAQTEGVEENASLTIWGDADNEAIFEPAFTRINETFMEKYPDVDIDYQYQGTFDTINIAVQSDSLPDLFWVQGNKSTQMAELARNGYLMPIEGLEYDGFSEESIEYATVDGEIYSSLPSFVSYVTMYYNADLFDEYGLEVPNTWEEFDEIVYTFLEEDITPISFGGSDIFARYWYIQATGATLASDDIDSIVEDKETATFEDLKFTFDNYQQYALDGVFGENYLATDEQGAQLSFTNGGAAMIADGTWNSALYENSGMNFGAFALPGRDGNKYAQTGPSNVNTYAVSSNTEYPNAATAYVEFLNSPEAQQIVSDEIGEVPMYDHIEPRDETVGQFVAFDETGANMYNKFAQAATETSHPDDLVLTTIYPELLQGIIDADEAIELLQQELEK